MDDLKWNLENFEFYYTGNLEKLYSTFGDDDYFQKFNYLLENDIILDNNLEIVKDKIAIAENERVTFDYFIDKELTIIGNELDKIKDFFNYFDWYMKNSGKCFVNQVVTEANVYDSEDTLIYVKDDLSGQILYVILPDGTQVPYDPDIYPDPYILNEDGSNNSIIISATSLTQNLPLDFCQGENVFIGEEYDFC